MAPAESNPRGAGTKPSSHFVTRLCGLLLYSLCNSVLYDLVGFIQYIAQRTLVPKAEPPASCANTLYLLIRGQDTVFLKNFVLKY